MRIRYFVRRPGSEPLYVFRVLPDVSVQVYDVAAGGWHSRPLEPLHRWAVVDGEIGVDEISAEEADAIVAGPRDPALHRLEMQRDAADRMDAALAEIT